MSLYGPFPLPSSELSDVASSARSAMQAMQDSNSAVVAKIVEDPSAIKEAIGKPEKLENFHGLLAAMGEFMKLDKSSRTSPVYVGVTAFGDSMGGGAYTNGFLYQALVKKFGVGAYTSPNLGGLNRNGGAWTLGGGAEIDQYLFTYTPGANWITMPSGSTASFTFNSTYSSLMYASSRVNAAYLSDEEQYIPMTYGVRKVSVYYVKTTGAGTIEATLSQTQVSDQVQSVSADAADGMGVLEFTPTDAFRPMTIALAASDDEVTVIGVLFWGYGGVVPWSSQQGGSTMTQQSACLSGGAFKAAYSEFFAALNTSLVLHQQRAGGDVNWQANYATFFSAYETLNGGRVSQLVLGEPPQGTEGSPTTDEFNTFLRAESASRGLAYIDQKAFVKDYAKIDALGFNISSLPSTKDTVHLGGLWHRYAAGRIMHECNHFDNALSSFSMYDGFAKRGLDRFRHDIYEEHLTRRTKIQTGYVPDGQATGGGYTISVDNQKGVRLISAAAIGHAVCRVGEVSGFGGGSRNSIPLAGSDVTVWAKGSRNILLPANTQGWVAFGMHTTAITALSAIAERSFGVEFALGSDVGSPDGLTAVVARIWCYDTTMRYSAWVDLEPAGSGGVVSNGISFVLQWDYLLKRFTLSMATPQNNTSATFAMGPKASLDVPGMTTTNGAWVNVGINATVAPATVGEISWTDVGSRIGQLAPPVRTYVQ